MIRSVRCTPEREQTDGIVYDPELRNAGAVR